MNIFRDIVDSTVELVARWQAVGFTHGVLNTDNMSIHGITIDYGPYAFMTYYDPNFVSNASDHEGRYSFAKQPSVCKWNLERLLESFVLLFPHTKRQQTEVLATSYPLAVLQCMMYAPEEVGSSRYAQGILISWEPRRCQSC